MPQNDPEDVPDMLFGHTIRFYCLMIHAIHLYTPEQKSRAKYLQPGFYYIYLMNGSPSHAVRNLMVAFGERTLTIDLTELVEQKLKRQARLRKS